MSKKLADEITKASVDDFNEKLFMKFVKDNYRLCTGMELEGWKVEHILKWYRFLKQRPLAKIVMGRKGPVIVTPKEDMRGEGS